MSEEKELTEFAKVLDQVNARIKESELEFSKMCLLAEAKFGSISWVPSAQKIYLGAIPLSQCKWQERIKYSKKINGLRDAAISEMKKAIKEAESE